MLNLERKLETIENLNSLLKFIDKLLVSVSLSTQLSLGGKAIEIAAKIWQEKFLAALDEWQNSGKEKELVTSFIEEITTLFSVQQSITFDISQLVEVEKVEMINDKEELKLDFNSKLIINNILAGVVDESIDTSIFYEENIANWILLIDKCLQQDRSLSFEQLVKKINLTPAQIFINLLQGNYKLEQDDFYAELKVKLVNS